MSRNINEEILRIKNLFIYEKGKVISEQDEFYSDFLKQGFKNCRGITLSASDNDGGFVEGGLTKRELKKMNRKQKEQNEAEFKNFITENGINKNELDLDSYIRIQDIVGRIKGLDNSGYYRIVLNEECKPFNPNINQKIVNTIQTLFFDSGGFYFYWKDVFGDKIPSELEVFQYLKSLGGVQKIDEIENTGYDLKKYRKLFLNIVESFENELKEKFPFEKPSGKTNLYFVWREGNQDKFRYFNTYEEWKLSLAILEKENNPIGNTEGRDGAGHYASARILAKPTKGASSALFK